LGLWQPDLHAAICIHLLGPLHIQIGERYLSRSLFSKRPECLADDRIIADFALVAVTEDENSWFVFFHWRGRRRSLSRLLAGRLFPPQPLNLVF